MTDTIASRRVISNRAKHEKRRVLGAGFTIVQLVLVMAILAIVSSLLLGVVGRGRAVAQRAECDAHLKEITMALDTFRQETGRYPDSLTELVDKRYLPPASMYCPADPNRGDATDHGYADFYLVREPRDSEELPMVVCPYHESSGSEGAQAFKGRYTLQNKTQPATLLTSVSTSIKRPGKGLIAGSPNMLLHGGDHIVTAAAGSATVRFVDGSTATLGPSCDVTLMESYVDGTSNSPLYTLVRQNVPATIGGTTLANIVTYNVHTGSGFDVATPTATAGALGTQFQIKVTGTQDTDTTLTVIDSTVALTTTALTEQFTVANGAVLNNGGGSSGDSGSSGGTSGTSGSGGSSGDSSSGTGDSGSTSPNADDSTQPITVNLGDKTRKVIREPRTSKRQKYNWFYWFR